MERSFKGKYKSFKRFYVQNKDLLPLILLLPTILGGILQTIQLLVIGTEYIRFFSFSQLVSDGILILSIITLIVIAYFFLKRNYNFKDTYKRLFLKDSSIKSNLFKNFIVMLIPFFIIAFFNRGNLDQFTYYPKSLTIGSAIAYSFIFLYILPFIIHFTIYLLYFLYHILVLILKKLGKTFNPLELIKNEASLGIIKFISAGIIMFMFFGSFIIVVELIKKTNSPNNLMNFKNISIVIKREFGMNQESKILYFNDKYFFVELINENPENKETKIIMYKTENILFK